LWRVDNADQRAFGCTVNSAVCCAIHGCLGGTIRRADDCRCRIERCRERRTERRRDHACWGHRRQRRDTPCTRE
jgi:hypothetical protein